MKTLVDRITLKKYLAVGLVLCCTGFFSQPADAASTKDQALSLTASGCLLGMLDSTPILNTKDRSFLVISTASSSQWNDATNNDLVQLHHNQLLEGWNLAANLDRRWAKLSNTYSLLYEYIGSQAELGARIGDVWSSAERKYGGIINANCKIALNESRAKAKKSKVTLKAWIIRSAGYLLPPLNLMSQ